MNDMKTPLCDFVKEYSKSNALRLHMPGHKGKTVIGPETLDITEIRGADVLYNASGVILESEKNASLLFGTAKTFYSCEGSSLAIRAMVYLAKLLAIKKNKKPKILAARNAHKTFVLAAAVLGVEIVWLYPKDNSLLCCPLDAGTVEKVISESDPVAVYITSPDYLGNIADIGAIADVCHRNGVCLMVDNAHGAYLKFLPESLHPIDLGADMTCDSAHKTLPALTGAAYLHISDNAPHIFKERAEDALSLFASTSPSYLILQSLDMVNMLLSEDIPKKIKLILPKIKELKKELSAAGFSLSGNEPMKLCICPKSFGYTGDDLALMLEKKGIVCEFSDPDNLVMMFSCENTEDDLELIKESLLGVERLEPITKLPPKISAGEKVMDPEKAMILPYECVGIEKAEGRILSLPEVSCPPAVPIAVCGERLDKESIECFEYYGIKECNVISEEL